MGRWSVSETGLNYLMEYTNGFKRSIRRSQVTKTSQGATVTYASSQSPNLTLAEKIYYIQSYTAGTSQIDFTNNGGDDWDIDFKIAMTSPQLPSGYTAPNYDVNVYFYLSGTGTAIDTNTGVTIDKTVNASGNGAGVYVAQQVYNILDSNLSNAGIIAISSLFKVNASGTLLAYFICNGVVVNSVNGLVINVTADISQSENYDIEWYSYDSSFNPTLIGTGLTASLTLPTDCAYLIAQPILDSVFTVDFPNQSTNISTVTII